MNIDIIKAKKEFKEYVKNYNPEDAKIKIKISHIERVSQIAKKLAEDLNLSQEDAKLAELIGLLHDIGRFEQIKKYNTFLDKDSVNHAEYGVKILFEDGLIRKFIKEEKYDKIIKLAILNHNKIEIEEGLTEKEKIHAKIIRDADKMDIFYILTIADKEEIWNNKDLSDEKLTDEVYKEFVEDKFVNFKSMKTGVDLLAAHFSYLFNLYFKESIKIIYDKDYLKKLYNRFKFNDQQTKEKMEELYQITQKYLEEKRKID